MLSRVGVACVVDGTTLCGRVTDCDVYASSQRIQSTLYILVLLLHSPAEHRPRFHRMRFWVCASSSYYYVLFFDISASTHICQVFLGLPLFRFLRGFHANACLVMRCVGFLRILYSFFKICSIGHWFVLSHGVSLLIVSGHYIFKKTKFQNHVWSTN